MWSHVYLRFQSLIYFYANFNSFVFLMSLREYVICCPPTFKEKFYFNGSRNFYSLCAAIEFQINAMLLPELSAQQELLLLLCVCAPPFSNFLQIICTLFSLKPRWKKVESILKRLFQFVIWVFTVFEGFQTQQSKCKPGLLTPFQTSVFAKCF